MNETLKPLLDYGALGAIVAVFLYYGIKTLNTLVPSLLRELQNLNKTMKLILRSLLETLPKSAKRRIWEEYLQEFSEEEVQGAEMADNDIDGKKEVKGNA